MGSEVALDVSCDIGPSQLHLEIPERTLWSSWVFLEQGLVGFLWSEIIEWLLSHFLDSL